MTEPDLLVDARGLLCPWPVLRLGRAARELGRPGTIRLLADDPLVAREVAQLCTEREWEFVADPQDSAGFTIVIR